MNETRIFGKGDRVVMNDYAIKNRLQGRLDDRTGTVVGFSRDGALLRIRRDKHKGNRAETFHPKFWNPIDSL